MQNFWIAPSLAAIKAIGMDRGEDEVNTNFQKRFESVQWGAFKGLIVVGFGMTTLAELCVMYMD